MLYNYYSVENTNLVTDLFDTHFRFNVICGVTEYSGAEGIGDIYYCYDQFLFYFSLIFIKFNYYK